MLDELILIYSSPVAWAHMIIFGFGFIIVGLFCIWLMKLKYTPQMTLVALFFSCASYLMVEVFFGYKGDTFAVALMIFNFLIVFFFGHIVSGSPILTFKKK